jgi:hypothetical protein
MSTGKLLSSSAVCMGIISTLVVVLLLLAGYPALATAGTPSTFSATGSLNTARFGHSATRLFGGKVLIAGGVSDIHKDARLTSAEIYDPDTGVFTPTGNMKRTHAFHGAVRLADGTVLIVGGGSDPELYDPTAGTFSDVSELNNVGPLRPSLDGMAASFLQDGTVLVTGGRDSMTTYATAWIYDPSLRALTRHYIAMTAVRSYHTATLLSNGEVLLAGGLDYNQFPTVQKLLETADLYVPLRSNPLPFFKSTDQMFNPRIGHTATRLTSGQVLMAGGNAAPTPAPDVTELYDPVFESFVPTGNMITARSDCTATLLLDGSVLLAGGVAGSFGDLLSSAEHYEPDIASFLATNPMNAARSNHTATLLYDGRVLVAGGIGLTSPETAGVLSSAEIYTPPIGRPLQRTLHLIATMASYNLDSGTQTSFREKLGRAVGAITAGAFKLASQHISSFINEAGAQAGKALTVDQYFESVSEAKQIQVALACQECLKTTSAVQP